MAAEPLHCAHVASHGRHSDVPTGMYDPLDVHALAVIHVEFCSTYPAAQLEHWLTPGPAQLRQRLSQSRHTRCASGYLRAEQPVTHDEPSKKYDPVVTQLVQEVMLAQLAQGLSHDTHMSPFKKVPGPHWEMHTPPFKTNGELQAVHCEADVHDEQPVGQAGHVVGLDL